MSSLCELLNNLYDRVYVRSNWKQAFFIYIKIKIFCDMPRTKIFPCISCNCITFEIWSKSILYTYKEALNCNFLKVILTHLHNFVNDLWCTHSVESYLKWIKPTTLQRFRGAEQQHPATPMLSNQYCFLNLTLWSM